MLTTLCIKSLAQPTVATIVDTELRTLNMEGFGAAQCRWLMHWVRQELSGWYASVQVSGCQSMAAKSCTQITKMYPDDTAEQAIC